MKIIWKRIKDYCLLFGSIIVSLLVVIFTGKFLYEKAKIKPVQNKKQWKAINDTTIEIIGTDNKSIKQVKLPKDPKTKKQIKTKDLEAVSITEKGKVNVEIKHNTTNRRITP